MASALQRSPPANQAPFNVIKEWVEELKLFKSLEGRTMNAMEYRSRNLTPKSLAIIGRCPFLRRKWLI